MPPRRKNPPRKTRDGRLVENPTGGGDLPRVLAIPPDIFGQGYRTAILINGMRRTPRAIGIIAAIALTPELRPVTLGRSGRAPRKDERGGNGNGMNETLHATLPTSSARTSSDAPS